MPEGAQRLRQVRPASHIMWTHEIWIDLIDGVGRGLVVAIAVLAFLCPRQLETEPHSLHLSTGHEQVEDANIRSLSSDAKRVHQWIVDTHDNQQSPFLLIDKRAATLYVFDSAARLRGATPVLLGAARGDDTVPGIGQRPIAQVRPEERTTPAGRFLAERGHDNRGEDVVWVDYDAGVSIHRVLTTNPAEHRLARLATPTVADNRISYGCINVPVAFYEAHIRPMFARQRAMVYVLPDAKLIQEVFAMNNAATK